MKHPVVILGIGAILAFSAPAGAQGDAAAFIKACQKDMIAHCAEQMSRPDGLKACLITKREKMSAECQRVLQQQ